MTDVGVGVGVVVLLESCPGFGWAPCHILAYDFSPSVNIPNGCQPNKTRVQLSFVWKNDQNPKVDNEDVFDDEQICKHGRQQRCTAPWTSLVCVLPSPPHSGGTLARRASFLTRALPVDCCR